MVTRKQLNIEVQSKGNYSAPLNGKHGYDRRVTIHAICRCLQCYALVNFADQTKHDEFHNRLNAIAKAIEAYTQPELFEEPPF